jgi:hypothetical protein
MASTPSKLQPQASQKIQPHLGQSTFQHLPTRAKHQAKKIVSFVVVVALTASSVAQLKLAEQLAELAEVEEINQRASQRLDRLAVESILESLLLQEATGLMASLDVTERSISQLNKDVAAQSERLKRLNDVASQVAVRKDLLAAALKRYQAISRVSINSVNSIETSDMEGQKLPKRVGACLLDLPDLATG